VRQQFGIACCLDEVRVGHTCVCVCVC
jgi:hypothetical protein